MTTAYQPRYIASTHHTKFAPPGAACDRCTAGCAVVLLCAPSSHRG